MSETNIFRPMTVTEKSDFIEVGAKTSMDLFLAKLADKQQEFARACKPFCIRCARIDFEKKIASIIEENSEGVGKAQIKGFELGDLDKYGAKEKFELLNIKDVREDKLLDGIRNTVTTGKNYQFKCKDRGCGFTMNIQNDEIAKVEAWLNPVATKA
jgi:hypothetical protein